MIFRPTLEQDIEALFILRAVTRENPMSIEQLAALGITPESSKAALAAGEIAGWVCSVQDQIVGFCSGDCASGEVLVLAVLPEYEGQGVGKGLLQRMVEQLGQQHSRIWLAANPDPQGRAYGFYRRQGFVAARHFDAAGDEILELALTSQR
ncbi:GNAT family N-acetyltransferase [Deefgea rivuli]|uniref:GNAT family N-acetyltransferase n=1 Tax=Deefgea rivuli TaxID=400948 RepID=UPI0006852A7C|nr:GNAT family N-acetyltransferase [Deefgea rivuli]